nr:restriction endonuclease subunit S [Macrococcus bohemicus]
MTNKNEQRKVPELRFPEFSGEWKEKSWGDLGEYKKSYSYSRAYEGSGKLRHIHYGDIHTKLGPDINNKDELNSINIDGDHELVRFGDLVIADASEDYKDLGKVTRVNIDDSNIISGLHTHLFRVSNEIDSRFLLYYSKTLKYQKLIRRYGTGVSVLGLSKLNLNKFDVNLPNIMEQQKIGEFFSKLDRQIELEEKKLALLEEQKKGYMQKIFSQELRFKDENGEEYPEWEKRKFKEILFEVNVKSTENNQYSIISSTNKGLVLQEEYFKKQIASSNTIGYKVLRKNQVVLSPQNLWMGNINTNFLFEIGLVSPSYKIFEINENYDAYYISQLLRTKKIFHHYKNASEQGASIVRRNLNIDLFYQIELNIPCIDEQKKISFIIKEFNKKIKLLNNKVNNLKSRKKYFINKMLI